MAFPLRARLLNGAIALTTFVAALPAAAAQADDPVDPPPGPPLRHVQYTVFAEKPYKAEIYYRDTDPPNWAEYSHNPYLYSPNIEVNVGPEQKWIFDTYLADPDAWAMVIASIQSDSKQEPNLHCVLAVDGVVVKTAAGPKGALCSIRAW